METTKQKYLKLRSELDLLQTRLKTLDARWEGVQVKFAFANGSGYDHSRYYKRLEKQKLTAKIKRRKMALKKLDLLSTTEKLFIVKLKNYYDENFYKKRNQSY